MSESAPMPLETFTILALLLTLSIGANSCDRRKGARVFVSKARHMS
jgi:hypothetical protein